MYVRIYVCMYVCVYVHVHAHACIPAAFKYIYTHACYD